MKNKFVFAAIAVIGSFALAEGEQRRRIGPPSARSSQATLLCEEGAKLDWFGPLDRIPEYDEYGLCGSLESQQTRLKDLNRDGAMDNLQSEYSGVGLSSGVGDPPVPVVSRVTVRLKDTPKRLIHQPLVDTHDIREWLSMNSVGFTSAGARFRGCIDLDDDGDLDLVFAVTSDGTPGDVLLWAENVTTGGGTTGDLNGDGVVSGADLGILIGQWSSQP
jgi:hypothetical protein